MKIQYEIKPPSLIIILLSLIYESLLISSVTFIALIIDSLIVVFLIQELPLSIKTLITSIIIIIFWYCYFISSWKKGQTLAMKTWNIYLKNNDNNIPSQKQLFLRFIWSVIFVIFIPLIIYFIYKNKGLNHRVCFSLAITWWLLPWGWAIFNKQKKFLYDQLSGTKLIIKKPK